MIVLHMRQPDSAGRLSGSIAAREVTAEYDSGRYWRDAPIAPAATGASEVLPEILCKHLDVR
jgi:alkylation response protein AidB-like acyl-CoA dehydrogenase